MDGGSDAIHSHPMPWIEWSPRRTMDSTPARWWAAVVRSMLFAGAVVRTRCGAVRALWCGGAARRGARTIPPMVRRVAHHALLVVRFASCGTARGGARSCQWVGRDEAEFPYHTSP
ncbi:hypothetical protein ACFXPM_31835 [Streptomyces sp. NPDC059095]|uniref:hypothetical protein n=1 Tax=Streptomyces sp. NPDC059095 TaxID=3346726 RepID=UPI0036D1F47F